MTTRRIIRAPNTCCWLYLYQLRGAAHLGYPADTQRYFSCARPLLVAIVGSIQQRKQHHGIARAPMQLHLAHWDHQAFFVCAAAFRSKVVERLDFALRPQPMRGARLLTMEHALAVVRSFDLLAFLHDLISWPTTPSPSPIPPIGSCTTLAGKPLPLLFVVRPSPLHPPPCSAPPSPGLRAAPTPSFHRPRPAQLSPELPP